jgi:protein involved in polysaccharide export with SLBB domain
MPKMSPTLRGWLLSVLIAFCAPAQAMAQSGGSPPAVTAPEPTARAPAPTVASAPSASNPADASGPRPSFANAAVVDVSGDAYTLGAGDRIRVVVFGEPDLSGEFAVDSTGSVALPLIGQTPVSGLTVTAFESILERRLKERRILNAPDVSAEVLNFRPFYILGEVARPGTYPYTSGLDVFSAVATAGGFAPLANQLRVQIKRAGETEERAYSLEAVVAVRPGDTIRVIKGSIYILGEVNRPGEYPFSQGMTYLNAVAAAGGFSYRANKNRVFIRREADAEETKYAVEPWLQVKPGDTIRVPERFF